MTHNRSLTGRRFFFGTKADLAPGLRAIEQAEAIEYVVHETRDDPAFTVLPRLSDYPQLGHATGHDVNTSPRYLIFRRGEVPEPRQIPQRRGGVKYEIAPSPDCLILRCGGLHAATGALFAGELQKPLGASDDASRRFRFVARELVRGFRRVKLYWVGPEALSGLRAGRRLVTISLGSPREYDLSET